MSSETKVTEFDPAEEGHLEANRQLRRRLEHYLLTSLTGFILDVGDVILSLVAVSLYIAQSYYPDGYRAAEDDQAVHNLGLASVSLALFFLMNFFLAFFVAEQRVRFLFTFSAAIDLVTITPLLIIWVPRIYGHEISFEMPRFEFLRFVRVLKILRILRLQRILGLSDSEVQRQIFTVSLTVLSIIICYAGLFQVIENAFASPEEMIAAWDGPGRVWFHDSVYFTVVTISTVGYGDFFPITVLGKFLVMIMIATTIIIISQQTNKLLTLMGLKSVYARNQFQATESTSHVVVCGYINFSSANNFFREFFHEDHGARDTSVVLLSPSLPSSGLEWLLRLPEYAYRNTYLEGSAMNPKDLARAAVEKANAVFILGDKTSNDPHAMDAASILRAMAVKKYVSQTTNGDNILVILQLLRPENKHHFALSGFGRKIPKALMLTDELDEHSVAERAVMTAKRLLGFGDKGDATSRNEKARIRHRYSLMKDQILCTDEIKLSLIAKSCLCPGFSTLVSNLITSSSLDAEDEKFDPWMKEYVEGTGHEIYRALISKYFYGMRFRDMVSVVFAAESSLIFAIEIADARGELRVVLNPCDGRVPSVPGTHVYLICEDKAQADKLSTFGDDPETVKEFARHKVGPMSPDIADGVGLSHISDGPPGPLVIDVTPAVLPTGSLPSTPATSDPPIQLNQEGALLNDHELDPDQRLTQLKLLFHVNTSATSLETATRQRVSSSEISGHILVCGSVTGLYHFVAPLRSRYLTTLTPIVVLHPQKPVKEWESVSFFDKIYYVQGSVLEPADLIRAGALTLSKAVVLSNLSTAVDDEGKEHMVDADSIFAFQSILQANRQIKRDPMPHIVCELVNPHNISFLMASEESTAGENKAMTDSFLAPPFTAGNVYVPSVLDMLACQAYYNQHLLTILQELVLVGMTSIARFSDPDVKPSFLFQVQIPISFDERPYSELFEHLVSNGSLPLALYRNRSGADHTTPLPSPRGADRGNVGYASHPYVVTNPSGETILRRSDMVFILSAKSPDNSPSADSAAGQSTAPAAAEPKVNSTNSKPLVAEITPTDEILGLNAQQAAASGAAGVAVLVKNLIREVQDIRIEMVKKELDLQKELSEMGNVRRRHLDGGALRITE